jgi:hypothetical protein
MNERTTLHDASGLIGQAINKVPAVTLPFWLVKIAGARIRRVRNGHCHDFAGVSHPDHRPRVGRQPPRPAATPNSFSTLPQKVYMVTRFVSYACVVVAALSAIQIFAGSTSLHVVGSAHGAPRSPLGDLSRFRKIGDDTDALLKKGDLAGAKLRIKDLETSWDEAEAGMKPRDAVLWRTIDKAIDRALAALRATTPDPMQVEAAVAEMLAEFDKAQLR